MKQIFGVILGLCITAGVIWGFYWIAKTVSYKMFYESMVQQTVRDMVKDGSLK